jgi:fumarylacetoacetate (FAA) hydrolase
VADGGNLVRFCVVEFQGASSPVLAVEKEAGLVPLDAPPTLRGALEQHGPEGLVALARSAEGSAIPPSKVHRWLPPVPDPRTFRDFYAFEQHVKAARARRGQEMIPEWYQIPVFYFSNPTSLKGHREPVKKPAATQELDFELEVACVIGKTVQDVSGAAAGEAGLLSGGIGGQAAPTPWAAAEEAIFGYLILNDWSARDLQRQEMKCMLGPAKGKDFATSIGPYVVTKEGLADRRVGPGKYDLTMLARRNGQEISRSNFKTMHYDFTQLLERASRDVTLHPGDLIGSGTCGTGCILELGPEAVGGWLRPGDTIELEIERLGTLTSPIK